MNYADLTLLLTSLAERLEKHGGKLEGDRLGKSASKLASTASRFAEELEGFLASRKSGELDLETMLRSPGAKRHLSVDLLKRGLKELTGKRLKAEELTEAKSEFVEMVHDASKSKKAAQFLQDAFAEAAHVETGGKEKGALQQEFLRLGRLTDEEFEREIATRTFGALRRIAAANGIRFTDKTTKQRLIALIRRFSQRAALNIVAFS
jgi:hypothetical protein